jgi:uncharacterized membrane protein
MMDMRSTSAERQKKLVLAGYVTQIVVMLITFGMPLMIIVPLIFLIVIRRFVSIDWLRRHIHWQLLTVGIGLAILLIAAMFLSVGLSEINRQTTLVGIVSQWIAIGLYIGLPPWLVYRFVRGLIFYGREEGMARLWP